MIFSIFEDLRAGDQQNLQNPKFANKDDLAIWISTTLIQALNQLIDLTSCYFDKLLFLLPQTLNLLKSCLISDNETLSRIGSTCLQKLVDKNLTKLDASAWEMIATFFVELFEETTPYFLFFRLDGPDDQYCAKLPYLKQPLPPPPDRKEFQKLVPKCSLHSVAVQTLQDVLSTGNNETVICSIPGVSLLRLMDCFRKSHRFASDFNECIGLRNALHKMGYMTQVPNLLKIETTSANFYLDTLIKLYSGKHPLKHDFKDQVEQQLMPYYIFT